MGQIHSADLQMSPHRAQDKEAGPLTLSTWLIPLQRCDPLLSITLPCVPSLAHGPGVTKLLTVPIANFAFQLFHIFVFSTESFYRIICYKFIAKGMKEEENSAGNYFEVGLKYLTRFLNSETISSKEISFICPKK